MRRSFLAPFAASFLLPLFDKETGGGSGDGGGSGTPALSKEDLLEGIAELNIPAAVVARLSKKADDSGGWKNLAISLADQLQKARKKLRQISEAPKDALIVTDKEEKDALAALKQKAGSWPKALEAYDAGTKAIAEIESRKKADTFTEHAKYATKDGKALNPKVFLQLFGATVPETELREIGEGDDKQKVTFVTIENNGTKETKQLADLAAERFPDFLPILFVETEQGAGDGSGTAGASGGSGSTGSGERPNVAVPAATKSGDKGGTPDVLASVLGPINSANATKQEK